FLTDAGPAKAPAFPICQMAARSAGRRAEGSISRSLPHLVVEKPFLVQRFQRTVSLEGGNRRIDRSDEIRALRENETEILGTKRLANQLQAAIGRLDIALPRRRVGQHQVHVTGLQRLDGGPESFKQLDARVLLVTIKHAVNGRVEGRGAGLRAYQPLFQRREAFG